MTRTHFAEGQILFKEGDPPDCVFQLVGGTEADDRIVNDEKRNGRADGN